MAHHRKRYEEYPEFRKYNPLERFKTMRTAIGARGSLDLTASHALRDAVVEFDPAVHKIERPGTSAIEDMRRTRRDDQPVDTEWKPQAAGLRAQTIKGKNPKDAQIEGLQARLEALEATVAALSGAHEGGAR